MTADANSSRELLSYFQSRLPEVLEFTRWLVEQESMTRSADATTRISESLAGRLEDSGADVEFVRDERYGATVIARFGRHSSETNQLIVVGHLDTVWPQGTLAIRPFRVEEGRAYGPGIFDMKSGVALAFFAMRALRELRRDPHRPVTLIMTCDEESGSPFSRHVVEAEARRARAGLVLEPPIPGGKLKTSRKGVAELELVIQGRAAHAGNDPSLGINAVTELAHQVLAINAMSNHELGTTVTVGVVQGGVLQNVIPAHARALIDLRFNTASEGDRVIDSMRALRPVIDGARLEVRGGINRPPMIRTAESGQLFEQARRIAAELDFQLGEGAVGGGSDGNFIAALGVPVLDGLGVDGMSAHAEDEHIIVADIPRRAALLARLIETI